MGWKNIVAQRAQKLKPNKLNAQQNNKEDKSDREIEELKQQVSDLKHKELLIDSLLHELRSINGDLKDCLDAINFDDNKDIIPIWAQANLLSIRMKMYDFDINPLLFAGAEKYDIPIFKRVEKVYKCLDNLHFSKNISIKLEGNTWLRYEANDIIEIAFYIIIHNAIKYAPEHSEITIRFIETGNTVKVVFSNFCELPDESELQKLTQRGYRGANAINGKTKGSGIGLYTMSKICNALGIVYLFDIQKDTARQNYGKFNVTLIFTDCR